MNGVRILRILEYIGLDTSRVKKSYQKVIDAIAQRDFRAAQVKKLANVSHGKFYRARLDDSNRLLFSLVSSQGEVCALILEVIENHAYEKSRFLRGAVIDESKIPDCEFEQEQSSAQALRYLHPQQNAIHLLDKPISFDEAQSLIYQAQPPIILVGSAGSGKTALTLEKMKQAQGEVLYVTHSAYLAQSARDLYYANGFEAEHQETSFLSYREFLESIAILSGREASWQAFSGWFSRMRQTFKGFDAHQVLEEIRGVITAGASGVLSRDAYLALGVKQSIFTDEQRTSLYDVFEKYQAWLAETKQYDLNLIAQAWMSKAQAQYDFVVVDEVQDLTPIQLALVLKTLKHHKHFLLCGDSNQIVHPNFFSWAQVKSLFWQDQKQAEKQALQVLSANFRNGQEATRVANQLLKIKHRRFGSIDRETNFLVQAIGGEQGAVQLMTDKDADKKALDQQIKRSTQFAVLVMRDEDKAEARKHFSTPLLFSIHEAKGLEYENIVLYRFVSDHRTEFSEIIDGVSLADLSSDELVYRRAKDKQDKSLEVYKFFVNALYVALTRAIRNLYLIESDTKHHLFDLLEVRSGEQVKVEVKSSSLEDWQKEARKLELQGKQEQADAIRSNILKQTPVPWTVFDQKTTEALCDKVFEEKAVGDKNKQQLYDIATFHSVAPLAVALRDYQFKQADQYFNHRETMSQKFIKPYQAKNIKDVLRQCEQYGLEHRTPMNLTPLMMAAYAGNLPLVEALIERGADKESVDHFGYNAFHWALLKSFRDKAFAEQVLPTLYDQLAPASIDVNTGERLVRLDQRHGEYFVFQALWVMFKVRYTDQHEWQIWSDYMDWKRKIRSPFGSGGRTEMSAALLEELIAHLPDYVVSEQRKRRNYLTNVLSRNEASRDYAYNRHLFMRIKTGYYTFNPRLSVRRKVNGEEVWIPIFEALNLPLLLSEPFLANSFIRTTGKDLLNKEQ